MHGDQLIDPVLALVKERGASEVDAMPPRTMTWRLVVDETTLKVIGWLMMAAFIKVTRKVTRPDQLRHCTGAH